MDKSRGEREINKYEGIYKLRCREVLWAKVKQGEADRNKERDKCYFIVGFKEDIYDK